MVEQTEQKAYFAIIPANVRYDRDLPPNAKLLYGEITALCNERGYCWATNAYFAALYQTSTRSVRSWISALVDKGYIKTYLKYKKGSKEVEVRYISIVPNAEEIFPTPTEEIFPTSGKKIHEGAEEIFQNPAEENFPENNTISFNNTFNNTREKERGKKSAPQAGTPQTPAAKSTVDYELFKNTYNEICTNLPKIKLLSEKRKTAVRNFLKQLTFEDFKKACELANVLDFTTGKNSRGWKADFDFLITVDKALGVIEGKYKDNTPKRVEPPQERSFDIDEFFDLACKRGASTPTAGESEEVRQRMEALKEKLG